MGEWGNGMIAKIVMDWIIPPFPTFSTSESLLPHLNRYSNPIDNDWLTQNREVLWSQNYLSEPHFLWL